MIGITSYGAYIPRLRLERSAIFQAMGWFAPALVMVAQGERSMCNHDEDSLTMAVAAARGCLTGMDKTKIDGSYLCSTTLPFADRQNAGILKTALNLGDNLITADFTASLRAGTTGPDHRPRSGRRREPEERPRDGVRHARDETRLVLRDVVRRRRGRSPRRG